MHCCFIVALPLVLVAGVVSAVYAGWDTVNHDVAGQVCSLDPCTAYVSDAWVRRRSSAVHHNVLRVANSRSTVDCLSLSRHRLSLHHYTDDALLRQHIGRWRWGSCRTSRYMPRWHRGMAVCTGGRRMSQWLLPATLAQTAHQIHVMWRRQGVGPGVTFHVTWYCNSLFHGISEGLMMTRLQCVHNFAACTVSEAWEHDHVTSVRKQVTLRRPPWSTARCPAWLRGRSSSAAFCQLEDVCHQADLRPLWRQEFCGCRPKTVEEPSS